MAVSGGQLDFPSVVNLEYWNGRRRQPAGFSFCGSTTLAGALRRGPALLVLSWALRRGSASGGPGTLCRGSASGPGPLQDSIFPVQRSVCRVWRFLSVCQGPTICVSALLASGPGALCRGFVSGPGALSVGARRSFYRAPAFSVRDVWMFLHRSSALRSSLCRGPALSGGLSVSGPGALCQRVCQGTAVPGGVGDCEASAVSRSGARRSLCRGPALLVSGPSALCVGARRSVSSDPRATQPAPRAPSSHPRATHPARRVPFFHWGLLSP